MTRPVTKGEEYVARLRDKKRNTLIGKESITDETLEDIREWLVTELDTIKQNQYNVGLNAEDYARNIGNENIRVVQNNKDMHADIYRYTGTMEERNLLILGIDVYGRILKRGFYEPDTVNERIVYNVTMLKEYKKGYENGEKLRKEDKDKLEWVVDYGLKVWYSCLT